MAFFVAVFSPFPSSIDLHRNSMNHAHLSSRSSSEWVAGGMSDCCSSGLTFDPSKSNLNTAIPNYRVLSLSHSPSLLAHEPHDRSEAGQRFCVLCLPPKSKNPNSNPSGWSFCNFITGPSHSQSQVFPTERCTGQICCWCCFRWTIANTGIGLGSHGSFLKRGGDRQQFTDCPVQKARGAVWRWVEVGWG